ASSRKPAPRVTLSRGGNQRHSLPGSSCSSPRSASSTTSSCTSSPSYGGQSPSPLVGEGRGGGYPVSWLNPLTWPIEPWVLLGVASPWLQIWRGLPLSVRRPVAKAVVKHPAFAGLRRVFAVVATPAAAWIISSANLWFWHWPAAYDLTLRNHLVHHIEHGLFLGLGILFWAQVIDPYPFRARLSQLKRVVYVSTAMIQAWALAA